MTIGIVSLTGVNVENSCKWCYLVTRQKENCQDINIIPTIIISIVRRSDLVLVVEGNGIFAYSLPTRGRDDALVSNQRKTEGYFVQPLDLHLFSQF